jgi:hypothetical protein
MVEIYLIFVYVTDNKNVDVKCFNYEMYSLLQLSSFGV